VVIVCGISGFYITDEIINASEKIVSMNDKVIHRGPDAEGFMHSYNGLINYYYGDSCKDKLLEDSPKKGLFMGHRRLKIIDLSDAGTQPMSKHNLTLLFNGEIYNYLEIKEDLISQGIQFTTKTDTEVILSAFHHWGNNAFDRFNGMWAIVIYDQNNEKITLSRDRFGIKPLYYFIDETKLIFSSEIKQILEYGIQPILNKNVLDNYLFYGISNFNDETFFQGIFSIPPSSVCYVELHQLYKGITVDYYYQLQFQRDKNRDFDVAAQKIEHYLNDSVRLRLRSDVEVGSCLSGGLDSSTIVAIASKIHSESTTTNPFNTYTTTHNDPSVDETYFSKLVNQHTGTIPYYCYFTSGDLVSELKRLVYHQEEPFPNFSMYGSYKVMQAASENSTKVLLDGQGGDEVFLGYVTYYAEYLRHLIKNRKFKEVLVLFKSIDERSALSKKSLLKSYLYFNFSGVRRLYKLIKYKKIFNPNYRFVKSLLHEFSINEDGFDSLFKKNLYQRIQPLLRYEDRNSMAFSIETRLPLLDYRLINVMVNLDPEIIIKDGWLKYLLRKSAESILPSEIVYRKNKFGFNAPDSELYKRVEEEGLMNEILELDEIQTLFNVKEVRNKIFQKNDIALGVKILFLGMWFMEFNAKLPT
jgi:asparagine synthase (glutamine-hydrolysing)